MPNIITDNHSGFSFGGNNNVKMMTDASLGTGIRSVDAAGITTGMAFLEGELEKRDPKIREPLTSVTWPRDIVAKTGGGWVDFTSTLNVEYGTTGANEMSLVGGATDVINLMQANINKDIFKVFTWAMGMKIPGINRFLVKGISHEDIPQSILQILEIIR